MGYFFYKLSVKQQITLQFNSMFVVQQETLTILFSNNLQFYILNIIETLKQCINFASTQFITNIPMQIVQGKNQMYL